MLLFWIIGGNLAICERGEQLTYQIDQFSLMFARCDWTKLSIGLQRMYLIFLADTQQPKYIQGYGRVTCTRATFKEVLFCGPHLLFRAFSRFNGHFTILIFHLF